MADVPTTPVRAGAPDEPTARATPTLIPLDRPADGIPPVVQSEREMLRVAEAIAAGEGPVALDAERASGYRYSQRAYLVQLRREGSGSFLIDPIAVPDLSPVNEAIGHAEWLLHAATQDLPCLAELGLRPRQLFDTELAGRLLGLPRVGLAAVVEHYLGLSLAKEHSAVDWSTRPLPDPWLLYAALDVEVLGEVRNLMGVDLARQGKAEWAQQEFTALLTWEPTRKPEPWRRMSGMHKVRSQRVAAIARELWEERDRIARDRDIAVGRIIPDAALMEVAQALPRDLAALPSGTHRSVQRYGRQWVAAVGRGLTLPEEELPRLSVRSEGPPPPRAWADRDPVAAARLAQTRERLAAFAAERVIPIENVCSPDPLRRVVWTPPQQETEAGFHDALTGWGCRPWQADVVAPLLAQAFADHPRG